MVCRLVKELSALKRGALEGRRRQRQYLQSLLTGLAACVSYIDTKAHALLLTEIHGISLWEADPVRPPQDSIPVPACMPAMSRRLEACLHLDSQHSLSNLDSHCVMFPNLHLSLTPLTMHTVRTCCIALHPPN